MARSNPVRYQYVQVGSDLKLAGIFTDAKTGDVSIRYEIGRMPVDTDNPRDLLWITKRAVTSALSRTKNPADLRDVPLGLVLKELLKDSQAKFRRTGDHIQHMFPKEQRLEPAVLEFIDAQLAGLDTYYEAEVAA